MSLVKRGTPNSEPRHRYQDIERCRGHYLLCNIARYARFCPVYLQSVYLYYLIRRVCFLDANYQHYPVVQSTVLCRQLDYPSLGKAPPQAYGPDCPMCASVYTDNASLKCHNFSSKSVYLALIIVEITSPAVSTLNSRASKSYMCN